MSATVNGNAGLAPGASDTSTTTQAEPKYSADDGARKAVGRRLWLLAYGIEERRQAHAASRRFWREAACCVGLALLRLVGAA